MIEFALRDAAHQQRVSIFTANTHKMCEGWCGMATVLHLSPDLEILERVLVSFYRQ